MDQQSEAVTQFTVPEFSVEQFLQENAFAVINLDGKVRGDFGHHFTLGLCRFGLPELYMHHPKAEFCNDILQAFGDQHMVQMLHNGVATLPFHKDQDGNRIYTDEAGNLILFTIRYLSGAQLLAAGEEFNKIYMATFNGEEFPAIYKYGIGQIFWPDEDNIPLTLLDHTSAVSAQEIEGVVIH